MGDKLLTGETTTESGKSPAFFGGSVGGGIDLFAWASGAGPTTRTCSLYQRLDLLATRDELIIQRDDAGGRGDTSTWQELSAQIDQVTEQIEQTRLFVRIRELGQSKREELVEEWKKAGISDPVEIGLRSLAAHIIEPEGFTYEVLAELSNVMPTQIEGLVRAMNELMSAVPKVRL